MEQFTWRFICSFKNVGKLALSLDDLTQVTWVTFTRPKSTFAMCHPVSVLSELLITNWLHSALLSSPRLVTGRNTKCISRSLQNQVVWFFLKKASHFCLSFEMRPLSMWKEGNRLKQFLQWPELSSTRSRYGNLQNFLLLRNYKYTTTSSSTSVTRNCRKLERRDDLV